MTDSGMEVEMIADLGQLPTDKLPAGARKLVERVTGALPSRSLAELYVRTRLTPLISPDGLRLDPASGMDIGNMNIPLHRIEEAFGKESGCRPGKDSHQGLFPDPGGARSDTGRRRGLEMMTVSNALPGQK